MPITFSSFPRGRMSANISTPEYCSLSFKGRAGVGMGLDFMEAYPIPHEPTPILIAPSLRSPPLKGEEHDKLALMRQRGNG